MFSRAILVLLAAFWLLMNGLLWRAEYGPDQARRSRVPLGLVWGKILTSPDSSSLSIVLDGRKIGYCSWSTSVGQEWAGMTEASVPAGMPRQPRSYRLRVEGAAIVAQWTNQVRFRGRLRVNAHQVWRDLSARLTWRPLTWRIHAVAAARQVDLVVENGAARFERSFTFSDLRNPGKLLSGILGPAAGELIAGAGLVNPRSSRSSLPALKWKAYEDTLRIGRADVPVYRLQTRLLDRYPVSVAVSRVGEILRVQLPNHLVLANDQLGVR